MEQRFGIFKANGPAVRYGEHTGNCLAQLNIATFDTVEEADKALQRDFPDINDCYVLPIYEYRRG